MQQRMIFRLLGGAGLLLGWTESMAVAQGDGQLRATEPVVIAVDIQGVPETVSVHWPDVNVETRVPWPGPTEVHAGDMVTVYEVGKPVMVVGPMPDVLAPVTVKTPISVGVPVGDLVGRP